MITACNNSRLHGRTAVPFRARLLAAFLGLALVAAGCGDDEADDASASASASATADASASATDTADEADENADTAQATDDGSSGDGSADGGEDGDAAAAGYYPVTIEHDLGSTTIPAAPVRVLAMTDQGELAALLAMGIKPIAYGQRVPGEIEYLAAAGAYDPEIEIFEGNAEINFEQLVTFQPDLIVGQIGFITPENIETYQEIAPTVPIGFDDWQQGLLDIGAIFDDVDTAEAKIAELEGLIADFPSRVPFAEGRSVSVALGFPGFGIYQLTNASILGGLLESAGAAPLPEPTNEQDPSGNQLSLEEIEQIDGEGLILLNFEGASAGGGADAEEFWDSQPLFPSLPSVAEDRYVYWSGGEAFASNFINALTIPVLLDALERTLTEFFAE